MANLLTSSGDEFWAGMRRTMALWAFVLSGLGCIGFFLRSFVGMNTDKAPDNMRVSVILLVISIVSYYFYFKWNEELKKLEEEIRMAKRIREKKEKAKELELSRQSVDKDTTEVPSLVSTLVSMGVDHYTKKKSNDPHNIRKHLPK